jgi:hypothetical protein
MSRTTKRVYRCRARRWTSNGDPRCTCVNLPAEAIEERVWAEISELLGRPERLYALAADYYSQRAESVVRERDELEQITAQVAKLERALVDDVAEYLRAGVAADVVKSATDRIKGELGVLRSRRAELVARAEDARGESERTRALIELAERASVRLSTMSPEERAEVAEVLDVRVVVLDAGTDLPRLRISGVLPFPDATTAGGKTLILL